MLLLSRKTSPPLIGKVSSRLASDLKPIYTARRYRTRYSLQDSQRVGKYLIMNDIIEVFNHYLSQCGSIDIAESEFKMAMNEDPDLKAMYRDWCHEVGSTEKSGFLDYCHEYLDEQNDVWGTLNDFDE